MNLMTKNLNTQCNIVLQSFCAIPLFVVIMSVSFIFCASIVWKMPPIIAVKDNLQQQQDECHQQRRNFLPSRNTCVCRLFLVEYLLLNLSVLFLPLVVFCTPPPPPLLLPLPLSSLYCLFFFDIRLPIAMFGLIGIKNIIATNYGYQQSSFLQNPSYSKLIDSMIVICIFRVI